MPQDHMGLPNPADSLTTVWNGPVHERIHPSVARYPEKLAVSANGLHLRYRDLDIASSRIANYIRRKGAVSDDIIAIIGERNLTLVAVILGVLKSGAAFTIIDPTHPAKWSIRNLDTIKPRGIFNLSTLPKSSPTFSLYLKSLRLSFSKDLVSIRDPVSINGLFSNYPSKSEAIEIAPTNLAYVCFTSGTTGSPNAVLSEHRCLSHFFEWYINRFSFNENDRFSTLSGLPYDPILRDLLTPLFVGGSTHIPPNGELLSGNLTKWMEDSGVTVAHMTPAIARIIIKELHESLSRSYIRANRRIRDSERFGWP